MEKEEDSVRYRELILQQAMGMRNISIANHFSYLLIKRRLTMMTRTRSGKKAAFKLIFALPVFTLLIMSFAFSHDLKSSEEADAGSKMNGKLKIEDHS